LVIQHHRLKQANSLITAENTYHKLNQTHVV